MTKADTIFKENIERILNEGVFSEQVLFTDVIFLPQIAEVQHL